MFTKAKMFGKENKADVIQKRLKSERIFFESEGTGSVHGREPFLSHFPPLPFLFLENEHFPQLSQTFGFFLIRSTAF